MFVGQTKEFFGIIGFKRSVKLCDKILIYDIRSGFKALKDLNRDVAFYLFGELEKAVLKFMFCYL